MESLAALQDRNQQLWGPQPATREKLIRRLEKRGMELVNADYVDADTIATHIVATSLNFSLNLCPTAVAHKLGHDQWIPEIAALLKRMGKSTGGRPRNDDDAARLLRLVGDANIPRDWKTIARRFEEQTGRAKSPEACRSAVRRARRAKDLTVP